MVVKCKLSWARFLKPGACQPDKLCVLYLIWNYFCHFKIHNNGPVRSCWLQNKNSPNIKYQCWWRSMTNKKVRAIIDFCTATSSSRCLLLHSFFHYTHLLTAQTSDGRSTLWNPDRIISEWVRACMGLNVVLDGVMINRNMVLRRVSWMHPAGRVIRIHVYTLENKRSNQYFFVFSFPSCFKCFTTWQHGYWQIL